jgi:hypothetical protein
MPLAADYYYRLSEERSGHGSQISHAPIANANHGHPLLLIQLRITELHITGLHIPVLTFQQRNHTT